MLNPSFWKNKKIFLTGHTGFKGSWLSLWLQSLGAQVTGYALSPPTKPNLFEVANIAKGMTSIIGDVQHADQLKEAVLSSQADIVIHMAAQSLVRYSYSNPVETYLTNVMGTVNLLEAVRHSKTVKATVNVTSDKCYENKEWVWGYRENDSMGGYDPYSSSKGCAELVTAAYRNSFFNEKESAIIASARAGNVIGGGDWAKDRLIPDIINAFMEKRPVLIRNPNAIRPWQHVLEPLHGYLILTEKLFLDGKKFSGGWNFGPNDEDTKPVSWIVDSLAKMWGEGGKWELTKSIEPHEAQHLKLDCSKAKANLEWLPKLSLSVALEQTVAWYKAYENKKNMREFTEQQIAQFQKGLNQ